MSLPTRPLTPAPAHDLSDADFAELDELLAGTPEPLEPLDVVMLDGYLCGVIVQPMLLESATWLAHVFDFDGRPLPDGVDRGWHERTSALILRRHAALNRALADQGWFDPLIFEVEEGTDEPEAEAADAGSADAGSGSGSEPGSKSAAGDTPAAAGDAGEQGEAGEQGAGLNPIAEALMPWVAGFQHANAAFPDLEELEDDSVSTALARLYRYLPAETEDERALVATLDREHPLDTLDDAIDDLVGAVADLYDLTSDLRYKVETVRREAPKVGRNDPCPCGSGKKFKQCHGAG